jgi:LPS-assembly protein
MLPRNFWFITALALCHPLLRGQALTNALPPSQPAVTQTNPQADSASSDDSLPDDPDQEMMPVAKPEPGAQTGTPVSWEADRQTWVGKTATLYNVTRFLYRDYILSADRIVYHQDTTEVQADGHLRVIGGPDDLILTATNGEMNLDAHTGRFYNVSGSVGVRRSGRTVVYSTTNPFTFTGRVLIENGQDNYRIVDGSMTNCRLPHPDWKILARSIHMQDNRATTSNAYLKLLGVPIFYLPWLSHPTDEGGRQSGFLFPVIPSNYNSIRGYTMGEQFYWVINRSMDAVIGTEYYSKRGWAPNGDFRYKGLGPDHLTATWNGLIDRGYDEVENGQTVHVNQSGADVIAMGRQSLSDETRIAGDAEYLSSYTYRLVFTDNFWQAIDSRIKSDIGITNAHDGFVPSLDLYRIENYASTTNGDEVRILKLPSLRYDVVDRPLGQTDFYWGLDSSVAHLSRSEPDFHVHNEGRFDIYPHISMPMLVGGWSIVPEAAFRETYYTGSQTPNLSVFGGGVPFVSHEPINRVDVEASLDVRPPAVERDFVFKGFTLRHVIEPELAWQFTGGIGPRERDILLFDTTDIAANDNEVGFSLTQRFYVKPAHPKPCNVEDAAEDAHKNADKPADGSNTETSTCSQQARQWASWQIAQRYYLEPNFGGAPIPDRRNIFDSTLDLTGVSFLTGPRSLSPIISRMRFEAIPSLRIEWDMDYDPKAGKLSSSNIFAGYSWGITTLGVGHALLNAVDEQGSTASLIQSQQFNPFIEIGKQNREGFNLAANAGYDFVHSQLEYAGVLGTYNWNCCGISIGYRKFDLGPLRGDDVQYLYSFTFANFGALGDVRRSTTVFRDPTLPPAY